MELLKRAVQSLQERAKTLVEMADLMEFYFRHEIAYEEKASEKFLRNETVPIFEEIIQSLAKMENLDKEGCHRLIQELSDHRGDPLVKIAQPLRVALTGKTVSPPMDEVMEALGREEVIRRIQRAIEYIKQKN
jgi:glutamyl-tRNA synthetase